MQELINKYGEFCVISFLDYWNNANYNPNQSYLYDVAGALVYRQLTLSSIFCNNADLWNHHVAPMLLRSMIELIISYKWICQDSNTRTMQFINYGLGRDKLYREKLRSMLGDDDVDIYDDWLTSQKNENFIDINLGSWTGINLRVAADEVGLKDLYDGAYDPFSANVHNQWHHVAKYNLIRCKNPMHNYHFMPGSLESSFNPNMHYLLLSSKYLSMTFEIFKTQFNIVSEKMLPDVFLDKLLKELSESN